MPSWSPAELQPGSEDSAIRLARLLLLLPGSLRVDNWAHLELELRPAGGSHAPGCVEMLLSGKADGCRAELHRQVVPSTSPLASLHEQLASGLIQLEVSWEQPPPSEPSLHSPAVEVVVSLTPAGLSRSPPSAGQVPALPPIHALHRTCALLLEEDGSRGGGQFDAGSRSGCGLLTLRERQSPICLALHGAPVTGADERGLCVLDAATGRLLCGASEDSAPWQWQQQAQAAGAGANLHDDIYESVAPVDWEEEAQAPPYIACDLHPYQRRALSWALWREGAAPQLPTPPNGNPSSSSGNDGVAPSSLLWVPVATESAGVVWYSPALGCFSRSPTAAEDGSAVGEVQGGILADEMGLGKTVEVIALVLAHPRKPRTTEQAASTLSSGQPPGGRRAGGTLIVTPQSLMVQWRAELEFHAPHLKVFEFPGLQLMAADMGEAARRRGRGGRARGGSRQDGREAAEGGYESDSEMEEDVKSDTVAGDWAKLAAFVAARMADADVVLTTYPVFTDEVHYGAASERPLRHAKKYPVPDSPLLLVNWWRTVMDEAQMVGSQVTSVARMSLRLSSVYRWGVTGTPMGRRGMEDLLDLLQLLKLSSETFQLALTPYMRGLPWGKALVRHALAPIMWRNTKDLVKSDLQLPERTLHTVSLNFQPVEKTFYEHVLIHTQNAKRKLVVSDRAHARSDSIVGANDADAAQPSPVPDERSSDQRKRKRSVGRGTGGQTKKEAQLETAAWRELTQLRLACIHPQLTAYWQGLRAELNLSGTGALSLADVQRIMVQKAQVDLQAKERTMCAMLNLLAEKILSRAAPRGASSPSGGGIGLLPSDASAAGSDGGYDSDASEGAGAGLPTSGLEAGEDLGPPPLIPDQSRSPREQAIAAAEMAYRIGENGIQAAFRDNGVMEQEIESIASDAAAWKAWRLIQVHTAKLLSELYTDAGKSELAERMRAELEKKQDDLLETSHTSMAELASKISSLQGELRSETSRLHTHWAAARRDGLRERFQERPEAWLSRTAAAVEAAKGRELRSRQSQAAIDAGQTQALLGSAVFGELKLLEGGMHELRSQVTALLGVRLLSGMDSRLREAQSALRGSISSAAGSACRPLTCEDKVPEQHLLWAAALDRSTAPIAAALARSMPVVDSTETFRVLGAAERHAMKMYKRYDEKVATMEESVVGELRALPVSACMSLLDSLAARLNILRLHRDLHTAEVQIEVALHNRDVMKADVESAAAGVSASLPPGAHSKSARALRRYIFGPAHGQRKTFQAQVNSLFDQKKYLMGQLIEFEGRQEGGAPAVTGDIVSAGETAAVATPPGQHTQAETPPTALQAAPMELESEPEGAAMPSPPERSGTALLTSPAPVWASGCAAVTPLLRALSRREKAAEHMTPARSPAAQEVLVGGPPAAASPPGPGAAETSKPLEAGALEAREAQEVERGRLCPACLDPLAGSVRVFPCGHYIHSSCFQQYASSHGGGRLPCLLKCDRYELSQISEFSIAGPTTPAAPGNAGPPMGGKAQGEWMTKLNALLQHLLRLKATKPDEKSLVFSQFPEALKLLGKALKLNGMSFVELETGRKSKKRALQVFKNDPECRVFLLSLRAGGAGLTLVTANHVFLLEPTLDAGIAQQAVARVHRIGQQRPVHITRFVLRDSIEESIQRLQETQQALLSEDAGSLNRVVTHEKHSGEVMRGLLDAVCGAGQ